MIGDSLDCFRGAAMRINTPRELKHFGGILLIFCAHAAIQFVLYRGRVVDQSPLNDGIVFLLPAALAAIGYGVFFARIMRVSSALTSVLVLLFTFVSFVGSMIVPLNAYGE